MFRVFMLALWAGIGIFLVKSYVTGIPLIPQYAAEWQKGLSDTALGGPFAGFKNTSGLGVWFQIAAAVVFALYAAFSIQIMKEFGPNAAKQADPGEYPK